MRSLTPLAFGALLSCACTCGDGDRAETTPEGPADREVWLRVCMPTPQESWALARALVGPGLDDLGEADGAARLLARATGLEASDVERVVDLASPLEVLLLGPSPEGGDGAIALIGVRRQAGRGGSPLARGRHEIRDRRGRPLAFLVGPRQVTLVRPPSALSSALSARGTGRACGAAARSRATAIVELGPGLAGSEASRSWVERQGAEMEASARAATARHGSATLADPEAVARMLGARLERARRHLALKAPAELEVTASSESLRLVGRLLGGLPELSEGGSSPRRLLGLVPADAYLVVASRSSGQDRAAVLRRSVADLARAAGDRLESSERARIEGRLEALAEATDGWGIVALRPGLEQGPLSGVAILETDDPARAARALSRVAALLAEGYLNQVADHLGARVTTVPEESGGARTSALRFAVAAPEWASGDRGAAARRLTGESPGLAWLEGEGLLLVAFGPDPGRDLARLTEASDSTVALPSILARPTVAAAVAEGGAGLDLLVHGTVPLLAALPTRGSPGAGALRRGGLTMASGDPDGWRRVTLHADAAEVSSLLRLLAPRRGG